MVIVSIGHVLLVGVFFVRGVVLEGRYPWLEQIQRQEDLVKGCAETVPPEWGRMEMDNLDHLLVDHRHQLLYCYVPKVSL